jgi:2-hydroxychromene-2-carboxylate isomerase
VSEAAVVERIAGECGLDGPALVGAAAEPEAKARVRAQTDDAIARGVFGVPTMETAGELFWGYDDFPQLELVLAGRDPIDASTWSKWAVAPRPSAARTRRDRREAP